MSEDELEEAASTYEEHCHEKKIRQKVVRFDDIHCELPQTPSTHVHYHDTPSASTHVHYHDTPSASTHVHYHDLHKSVSVECQKSIPTDLQRRVQGLLNK